MDVDQRKRLLAIIFEEIVVGPDGIAELLPREVWKAHVRAALKAARVLPERKTGLYIPNVETVGLMKDERGWLRFAVR